MLGQYDIVYAIHDFKAEDEDEVSFKAGEEIIVLERDAEFNDGWWMGRTQDGQIGLFPANFTSPTPVSPTTTETSTMSTSMASMDRSSANAGGAAPGTSKKHPNHRESVQSFDALDQYESLISDLRKSIHLSSNKLAELRKSEVGPENGAAPALPALPLDSMPLTASPAASAVGSNIGGGAHSTLSSRGPAAGGSTVSRNTNGGNGHYDDRLGVSGPGASPIPHRSLTPDYTSIDPRRAYGGGGATPSPGPNGYRSRPPHTWSAREVADWLSSVGFANFADHFLRNEINGEAMLSLSLPTLKELDIPALGKRIQIMNSIISLKEEFGLAEDGGAGGAARGRLARSSTSTSGQRGRSAHLSVSPGPGGRMPSPPRSPNLGVRGVSRVSSRSSASGAPPSPKAGPMHVPYGAGSSDALPVPPMPTPARIPTPTPRDALDVSAADLSPADCEGQLKTLENTTGYAGKDGDFKRRWMVLKGNALYWFKDAKTAGALHCIYVHSGFKVAMDESVRSGKHAFRVTELNPEAGPRKHWLFYTDDVKEARKWMRSLTKATIFHSQHEASKRGADGVEIIGDPREVISAIRVNDDHFAQSELGQISRDWMDHEPRNGQQQQQLSPRSPGGSGRRPSLPGHHSGSPTEYYPPLPGKEPILRSKSTEPYDYGTRASTSPSRSLSRSGSSGGNGGSKQRGWDDGREREITRMRQQQAHFVAYVNGALPPNESITALRDLVPGVGFIHFLSNIARTPLPPHYARAVRDPAVYRIDWLDNWDVVLSWASELGVGVPPQITVEKLASGREDALVDLIEAVQASFAPRPPAPAA
ncbi:hypothetical protein H9P43_003518 [Blastocladiella emersonii ATCC 22665]|nr:hypothetical protein H9P43_003518 [Blastocladiella emersonii ATCC 22665]